MYEPARPRPARPVSLAALTRLATVTLWLALSLETWPAEAATGPWRLGSALETPGWLEISGEQRTRYETLDGQFRTRLDGGDQALALRTSLLTQLKGKPGRIVAEILDARQYLSDEDSPIDTTMVSPLDVLQAHVRWDAGDLLPGGTNTVRLGRETLDLGSRRFVARNAFRNTINAFTGIDWLWQADGGGSIRGFYLLPVRREPATRRSLLAHELEADEESFDQQFMGVHGEWPPLGQDLHLETYYYYLGEDNAPDSRHRRLHTPGLRLSRPATPGRWDLEVESDFQAGRSRLRVGTRTDLDHQAHHHHAAVGYTFEHPWRPRIGVRYDYASGDSSPADGRNERFDTLFGARRFEFGPTGIYGAIARANLHSPEYNVSLRPHRSLELSLSHRFLWLAEPRDAWTAAGVWDPTGKSGTKVGQQLETRLRWEALPGNLRVDTGWTHLFLGEFPTSAPNRSGEGDTNYAYFEVTVLF